MASGIDCEQHVECGRWFRTTGFCLAVVLLQACISDPDTPGPDAGDGGPDRASIGDSLNDSGPDASALDGDTSDGALSVDVSAPDLPPDLAIDLPPDLPVEAPIGPNGCPTDHFRSGGRCVSRIVNVAAAEGRTCAVTQTGEVWCWGGSQFATRPERQPGIDDAIKVSLGGYWGAFGSGFVCALTRSERVLCWGNQHGGQLGDGVTGFNQRGTPAPVVTASGQPLTGARALAVGLTFGCAITADSKVHCWGDNSYGDQAAPIGVGDGFIQRPGVLPEEYYRPYAVAVAGVTAAVIGTGYHHVMAADGQGKLCGWGGNGSGHRYWPVVGYKDPMIRCRDHADVAQLGSGFNGSCLRQQGGDVACWGYDLGVSDLPGARANLPPASDMATGSGHACAVLTDGRAFCWGHLRRGELGSGVVSNAPSNVPLGPQQVMALGNDAIGIGSGVTASHTCAIKRDGSLLCWGRNDYGQVGNPTAPAEVATPVEVSWQ